MKIDHQLLVLRSSKSEGGSTTNHLSRRKFLAGAGIALASGCLHGCALGNADTDAKTPEANSKSAASGNGPREASWYERLDDKKIRCMLCPRQCVVPSGKRGECGVRENRDGRYYTLVYGKPVAVHLDPIEKKPLLHVYPGTKAFSIATVGCNLKCKFCQNWEISQANPDDVHVPFVKPEDIARAAVKANAKTIAYTYSEPTVFYEYIVDCAKAGKDLGIESVMVSNGFIAEKSQKALFQLMKAIKIDLKAFTQDFYGNLCSGFLKPVLESLKRVAESEVWLEIVVLLIPTLNDNPDDLKRMAAWVVKELGPDVPLIFTRYHPAYKIRNIPATPAKTLHRAVAIAMGEGCHYVYGGNVPGMKSGNTYCPDCKSVVVDRYGYAILKNTTGKCKKCGKQIPGVWN